MKVWAMGASAAILIAAAVTAVACAGRDDTGASSGALSGSSSTTLWGPDSGTVEIPYCITADIPGPSCMVKAGLDDDGGYVPPAATITGAELARYVRAIESSWPMASRMKYQYTGLCDRVNDASQKVVVWVVPESTTYTESCNADTSNFGAGALRTVNAVACPEEASVRIKSNGDLSESTWSRRDNCAVHEFGHVLGWSHEQDQDAGWSDPGVDAGQCQPNGSYDDAGIFQPDYNDVFWTEYDPDSVMNYCRERRAGETGDGRLSDLDIQGTQNAYGAPDQQKDSDGDGYADYRDNCPYVVNGTQDDANFESEVREQIREGFTSDDGHRPVWGVDSQAYIDRWHLAYAGDACDPIVADRGAPSNTGPWANSAVRTASQCWTVKAGGINSKTLGSAPGGAYPIRYNSNMQLNAFTGGPAGLAGTVNGTPLSAPSFCECQYATDADPAVRAKCQQTSQSFHCYYGDDSQFPALDNSTVPGSYFAIHSEYNGFEQWFGQVRVSHVDPMPGYAPKPLTKLWANAADYATFGFPAFPSGGYLTNTDHPIGVFWTQVQVYPYSLVNLHPGTPVPLVNGVTYVSNAQNAYAGVEAGWDYGVCSLTFTTPFAYQWGRVPYCDPNPNPLTYGYVQHMVATPSAILATNFDGSVTEITSSFTASAITAMANLSSGAWDELAADDRVSGQARDDTGPNAILVDTGTTRIRGAFVRSGSLIDVQQPGTPVGTQSTAALRTYAAGANTLYSIEYLAGNGTYQLTARNVSDALAGTSTVTTINLGVAFASPKAAAYDRTNGLIYVADVVPSGRAHYMTLATVTPSTGALAMLWRSAVFSNTVPVVMLSTTTDGELLLGVSGLGDGNYHVLHMDSTGRPLHSYAAGGALYSAVVGHSGSITIPLQQTVTSTTPNARFVNEAWDAMSAGACGSSWLKAVFARTAPGVTGALHDGMVCPDPITNGGFEGGTFLNWTATGQSETISTNAHSGTYSAMLGATTPTNGDSTVKQTFVVPAAGGTLSFWYSNVCPDTVTYDWFTATLVDSGNNLLATIVPKTCAATSAWTQATLNLGSWTGQTVTLVLTSHDDNYPADPTYSFVDDVGVQ